MKYFDITNALLPCTIWIYFDLEPWMWKKARESNFFSSSYCTRSFYCVYLIFLSQFISKIEIGFRVSLTPDASLFFSLFLHLFFLSHPTTCITASSNYPWPHRRPQLSISVDDSPSLRNTRQHSWFFYFTQAIHPHLNHLSLSFFFSTYFFSFVTAPSFSMSHFFYCRCKVRRIIHPHPFVLSLSLLFFLYAIWLKLSRSLTLLIHILTHLPLFFFFPPHLFFHPVVLFFLSFDLFLLLLLPPPLHLYTFSFSQAATPGKQRRPALTTNLREHPYQRPAKATWENIYIHCALNLLLPTTTNTITILTSTTSNQLAAKTN